MPLVNGDRVREYTDGRGDGLINLQGAVRTYRRFVDGVGVGNQTYYAIVHSRLDEFEVGLGTIILAGAIYYLQRDVVYASSNAGQKVYFSKGQKQVSTIYPGTQIDQFAANVSLSQQYAIQSGLFAADASLAAVNSQSYRDQANIYMVSAGNFAAAASAASNVASIAAVSANAALAALNSRITYGTASPSGGNDGDIYFQYT